MLHITWVPLTLFPSQDTAAQLAFLQPNQLTALPVHEVASMFTCIIPFGIMSLLVALRQLEAQLNWHWLSAVAVATKKRKIKTLKKKEELIVVLLIEYVFYKKNYTFAGYLST